MQRKLIMTSDGSHSMYVPEMNVTYHSVHGAIQESIHVFIREGLIKVLETAGDPGNIKIFEPGLGTGLNALLTLIVIEDLDLQVHYNAIELYPLAVEETKELNYCLALERSDLQPIFEELHNCEWIKEIPLTPNFTFKKSKADLINFSTVELFDLIYFDAFDPQVQPELWTKEIFEKMFSILEPGGILVTYSSKGKVRRAMRAAGFSVEKIPGPAGKREIVRATKTLSRPVA